MGVWDVASVEAHAMCDVAAGEACVSFASFGVNRYRIVVHNRPFDCRSLSGPIGAAKTNVCRACVAVCQTQSAARICRWGL